MSETTLGAGFSTLAIHAGARPDPACGALPIYQTSRYFEDADPTASCELRALGNDGSHRTDPMSAILEERVATLEGGTAALAVATGQAARILAFRTLLQPGDEIVAARHFRGGTIDNLEHSVAGFGWTIRWADAAIPESFVEALSDRTKAIFVESIADPGGQVTDIESVAAIARRARVPLIVDNTLATPYLLRPFEHGADIIVHSGGKWLGGVGGARGGIVVDGGLFSFAGDMRYPALAEPLAAYGGLVIAETFGNFAFAVGARALGLRDIGAALSPFDASVLLTGIETLALRMQRHCDNALVVARHLASHPGVIRVNYAGLQGDLGHALAQRYCPKGAGAMFSFDVGDTKAAVALTSRLKLFAHRTDVGGARSHVRHSAAATPFRQSDGATQGSSKGSGLVRLSIGLEDVADIIADLDQALA